jgi:hypothetical protein
MDEPLTPAGDVRAFAEQLAERLNATIGTVRLELIFRDGRYVDGYRHTRLNPRELAEVPVTHSGSS